MHTKVQQSKLTLKPYIWSIFALSALTFLMNRHIVRPYFLESVEFVPLIIVINSLPNFIEGVIGPINLLILWLLIKGHSKSIDFFNSPKVYLIATLLAGLFVIPQELNWINLSVNKVYDPFDVLASVIGLILINRLLNRFDFVKYSDQ